MKRAALLESERRISGLSAELSAARGLGPEPDAADVEPRYDIDRVVSLVDQIIGLRAEVAEERYHHELALEAAVASSNDRLKELLAASQQAEDRATASERRVAENSGPRARWRAGRTSSAPLPSCAGRCEEGVTPDTAVPLVSVVMSAGRTPADLLGRSIRSVLRTSPWRTSS